MTISATLTVEQAASTTWPVIVVGAGPAGAMTAMELARRGTRVLLIDKQEFPRYKVCGSCLNLRALAVLNEVGLGDLPDRLHAVPTAKVRISAAGRHAEIPLPGGVSLSREQFDAALIDAAIIRGADFLPATFGVLGAIADDRRELNVQQGKKTTPLRARLIVAADGLGGRLMNCESDTMETVRRGSRIGSGVVIADDHPDYPSGTIHMACGHHGYVGLVRLEDDRLALAAAFDPDFVKSSSGLTAATVSILEDAGLPIPSLGEVAWRGVPQLTRRASSVSVERVLAVGDAVGYVEPFTGEGMAWALACGVAVAPLAEAGSTCWDPAIGKRWARSYRDVVRRRQRTCRLVASALRHPRFSRMAVMLLAKFPGLAQPFIRTVNTTP